ncbi:MAG: ThuA domain-containing protein, partial [Phycisphaeraceae bacterium]
LGPPEHPVSRGVNPFEVHEEFYYSVRFREDDARRQDILLSQPPGEPRDYTVAWAIEREDGGRGFGLTGGHYYDNWWDADYRKLTLNAIVWTAGVEVPEIGVEDVIAAEPLRALILTGHHHPGHDWRALTEGLREVIELDPRTRVDVWEDVERLADESLEAYDVIVLNYNNWDRPGLSDPAKQRLIAYLQGGGGLSVIHFANGAFHKSLPNAESDWPEYRRMVRRVWDHQTNSGHDAHRELRVDITDESHPITDGLEPFVTRDELYYRQQGDEPIVPLATAHSQDTDRNEPMAWAYNYRAAQVFQTVLGHDAAAVRHAGDLIRRGTVWAAGHPQLGYDPVQPPVKMFSEGQFGEALDFAKGTATIASHDDLSQPPLTVEAWTQLRNADGFNIIVANEDKGSGGHWELYSYAGTGALSVFMLGYEPVEVRSSVNVADGQWHHVAMTFDGQRVRLFVDGEQVADATVERNDLPRQPGPLTIGYTTHGDARVGSDGLIEQVRVRRGVHDVEPTGLMQPDDETVGLWRFEAVEDGRIPSGGSVKNAATLD